jgi:hypothetical protein
MAVYVDVHVFVSRVCVYVRCTFSSLPWHLVGHHQFLAHVQAEGDLKHKPLLPIPLPEALGVLLVPCCPTSGTLSLTASLPSQSKGDYTLLGRQEGQEVTLMDHFARETLGSQIREAAIPVPVPPSKGCSDEIIFLINLDNYLLIHGSVCTSIELLKSPFQCFIPSRKNSEPGGAHSFTCK